MDEVATVEARMLSVLGGDEPEWTAPPRPAPDERAASAMLYRYRRLVTEHDRVAAAYDDEIRRLEQAKADHLDELNAKKAWLSQSLRLWHAARLAEDASRKTIRLPAGTLKSSKAQQLWDFGDGFLEWAQANLPDAVTVPEPKPVLSRTAAKHGLADRMAVIDDGSVVDTSTGEVIPGLFVKAGGYDGRNYTISLGDE